jgi:hypothetical protein
MLVEPAATPVTVNAVPALPLGGETDAMFELCEETLNDPV